MSCPLLMTLPILLQAYVGGDVANLAPSEEM